MAASPEPVSPAEIRRALAAQGHPLSDSGLYTMVKRLTEKGELRKIADGEYTLPSRNGSEPASANGSGAEAPAEGHKTREKDPESAVQSGP